MRTSQLIVLSLFLFGFTPGVCCSATTVPVIEINTVQKNTWRPQPLKVPNRADVTVSITKNLVEQCSVETKREELTAGENPFVNFLGAFSKVFMPAATQEPSVCANLKPEETPVPPAVSAAPAIKIRILGVEEALGRIKGELNLYLDHYKLIANRANVLVTCKKEDGSTADPCDSIAKYKDEQSRFLGDSEAFLDIPLPNTANAEDQLTELRAAVNKALSGEGSPVSAGLEDWLKRVRRQIDCFTVRLQVVKEAIGALGPKREAIAKLREALRVYEPALRQEKHLAPDQNVKVTGTVTCKNAYTNSPTIEPVPFVVTYSDLPRLTATVGVLYSSLERRKLGTEAVQTNDSGGFKTVFAETEQADWQIIPFSFLNLRLLSWRREATFPLTLNLSAGVGLNSNSGSKEPEFFLGPSLGIGNLLIHVGAHAGRFPELKNGFSLGATVPDKFPGVPVRRRTSTKLAIAISYGIPIK